MTLRYFKRQTHYFLNRLFKMPVSDESLPMCVQDQICQRTFLGRVTEILVTLAKISLGSLVSYWITFSLMHKSTTGWENFWSGVVYVGILQLGFCNWSPASWAHGWAAFTLWSSLFRALKWFCNCHIHFDTTKSRLIFLIRVTVQLGIK